MHRLALAALLVVVLSGMTCQRRDTAPVVSVPERCRNAVIPSVDPADTGVRWTCDAETAQCWDALKPDVIDPLVGIAVAGELARLSCLGVLQDLDQRGVIVAPLED